jgi:predicted ester cyclase
MCSRRHGSGKQTSTQVPRNESIGRRCTLTPDYDVIRQFIDVIWNLGETDRIAEFIHEDYAVDGTVVGPGWVADNVASYRLAFPDLEVAIVETVSDRNHVAALLRLRGTHQGLWRGILATGLPVDYREAAFWSFSGGKIVSGQFVAESLTLRVQLGQIPRSVWTGDMLGKTSRDPEVVKRR